MPSRPGRPLNGPARHRHRATGPKRWTCCSGAARHDRDRHVPGDRSPPVHGPARVGPDSVPAPAGGAGKGALTRSLARIRDPGGFARLQALCGADPHVSAGAVSLTLRRTAEIIAAKGGVVSDITVGVVLELMDREAEHFTCPVRD